MLLIAMSLALAVQDGESALTPGACHEAGERFASFVPSIQSYLDEDAKAAKEGKPTKLTDSERGYVATALARDRKALAVVEQRYAKAVPNDDEAELIAGMKGSQIGNYVRRCGEAK